MLMTMVFCAVALLAGAVGGWLAASAGKQRVIAERDMARAERERSEAADVILGGDELTFTTAEAEVAEISRALVGAGLGITALVPEELSLESFFFELTEGDQPVEAAA